MAPPIRTKPRLPLSLSHQEASISHLSFYIRRQTDWKHNHRKLSIQFSSVQSLSRIWLFATPRIAEHQASLSITNSPRVHSNSHISSWWCHLAISSSVVPFSCPQSLPSSESFPMSHLFTCGQSIGVSALASVLPMNTQDGSPLKWTGWISLQSKGLSRVFSNTTVQKHRFFGAHSPTLTSIHDYWKNYSLD